MKKWRSQDSEYFRAFRAQLPLKEPPDILGLLLIGIALVLVLAGVIIFHRFRKKSGISPYRC